MYRHKSKKWLNFITGSEKFYYDEDEMVLGSNLITENTFSRQAYVSNGYIGSRIPNLGFGYSEDQYNPQIDKNKDPSALINGWPLRNKRYSGAFISDFYCLTEKLTSTNFPELDEEGYTSVLSAIPQWTDVQISLNRNIVLSPETVNIADIKNYGQNLSMAHGMVTTEFEWLNLLKIRTSVLAHKKNYPIGLLKFEISLVDTKDSALSPVALQFSNILNFSTSHRTILKDYGYNSTSDSIYMVVEPKNVPYSNAAIVSMLAYDENNIFPKNIDIIRTNHSIEQLYDFQLTPGETLTIYKYSVIHSTEFTESLDNLALSLSLVQSLSKENKKSKEDLYEELELSHVNAWTDLYNTEAFVEIPSNSLLEMTVRSSIYHLLANTRKYNISSDRGLPVPVSGLSSDSYGGMVFWDADLWMMPGILPFAPAIAKHIVTYRNSTQQQARLNAAKYNMSGALYPWTSARFANCTSTGPCVDYEYHINIDIVWSAFILYLSGAGGSVDGGSNDEEYLKYTLWPMMKSAADFFESFVKYNETLDKYTTHNLTDPDEFSNFIDNGAFTNGGIKLLMKWVTDVGNHLDETINPKWLDIHDKMYIPTQNGITLEYSGMNSTTETKQSDVLLLTYPLSFYQDNDLDNAINNLYYYSQHQSADGPSMTYPVYAAAANYLLNHGCSSQGYLYKSIIPYLRSPFAQFSEQSNDTAETRPAFPFLTANGGFLQSVVFGLTGLRYSYEMDDNLKIKRYLEFNPVSLPLLPGGLAIRNFKYLRSVLDIELVDNLAIIKHKSGDSDILVKVPNRTIIDDQNNTTKFPNNFDYVEHILPPHSLLEIPAFEPLLNVENSVSECAFVENLTPGVSGDVSLSILDGNNYTHWQPLNKQRATLLIDIGTGNAKILEKAYILWGERPAANISISILPHGLDIKKILKEHVRQNNSIIQDESIVFVETDFDVDFDIDFDIESLMLWEDVHQKERPNKLIDLFKPLVTDYKIKPSEPVFENNNDEIRIIKGNETEIIFDYDNIDDYENYMTRFILVSVEGTIANDDVDDYGATIREIALI
ncbi:alpha,alpha-trehalase ATH1 SCDLUD_000132 [Saccharomycodes ludwigii]|uniref:alpha,alpha-trehalase ATH1 n=1 Tax=Saccharomycodes ludwigii TaxID=36035 RepID=UPI001E8A2FB0|nr:hypothetical protein SCDLUD_000132 [Saccharomycodes ludwigii]KAH3902552.1 hypothetical protein SCDLUD_000132 [Saccharomycodes ludwigii]